MCIRYELDVVWRAWEVPLVTYCAGKKKREAVGIGGVLGSAADFRHPQQ
jgi:hypothetical protein